MGFWAGIKHAINSTLGTADFKPLDKIIEGQRTLAASDSVIRVLKATETRITSSVNCGTFTPKIGNSVRIVAGVRGLASSGSTSFSLNIVRADGDSAVVATRTVTVTLPITSQTIVDVDVPIEANSPYKVEIDSSHTTNYVCYVNVCANIIDSNLVEVN